MPSSWSRVSTRAPRLRTRSVPPPQPLAAARADLDGRQRRRIDAPPQRVLFEAAELDDHAPSFRRRATAPPPRHATAGGRRPVYERPLTREMLLRYAQAGTLTSEVKKWAANMALA